MNFATPGDVGDLGCYLEDDHLNGSVTTEFLLEEQVHQLALDDQGSSACSFEYNLEQNHYPAEDYSYWNQV